MAKENRLLFWAPRMLGILFAVFLAVFSLDVFENCNDFLNCALGLIIHNIPSIILLIVLIASWKNELVGAISFLLAGMLYIMSVIIFRAQTGFELYYLLWFAIISGPAFLISILFFIGYKQKKRKQRKRR